MSHIEIKIDTEYITLGQFLKFAGIIDRGSEAKTFLQDADIKIDGESENRRGRKLRGGETLEVNGQRYFIGR